MKNEYAIYIPEINKIITLYFKPKGQFLVSFAHFGNFGCYRHYYLGKV